MENSVKNVVKAPWPTDFVLRLRLFQESEYFHPYTCIALRDGNHTLGYKLVPTVSGFFCPSCDYRQDWAQEI